MRLLGLLAMVAVAGGLGLTLYLTRERAARENVPTDALLEGRRLADARRIVLRRAADARPIHLAHGDAREPFAMVEPIEDLASPAFVESLRAVFETAQRFLVGRVADQTPDAMTQMGLDAPRAGFEVRFADATFAVDIGLEGPLLADLFIRCNDNVYRTGLAVYSVLQANVSDVRERALLRTAPDDIRKLTLRRRIGDAEKKREEVIEIERTGQREFRMLQPLATRASPQAAAALFSFLAGMRIEQFLDDLNPMPEWSVMIEIDGAFGPETITIWETESGIIGRQAQRGVDFVIKSVDYTRTFQVPVEELRGRVLVPVPANEITRIELDPGQGNGERVQLRRGFGDTVRLWQPLEVEADAVAFNELLQATQGLSVVEFLDVPAAARGDYGLASGFFTVSVHAQGAEHAPVVLQFGRTEGEHTYVRRADEEFVAKVPNAPAAVFKRPWTAFATRQVTALGSQLAVGVVSFVVDGQARVRYARGADGRWQRAGSDKDYADQIVDLLELARSVRGRQVLDMREPAVHAELTAALRIDVRFEREADDVIATLPVYDRGGDKPALVQQPGLERLVVELGVNDSRAILDLARE